MAGNRFAAAAALLILSFSTGCRCWCERHYGACGQPSGYYGAPAPAAAACVPCQPCVPCCPPGSTSGYPAVPAPPGTWTNPTSGTCAPCQR